MEEFVVAMEEEMVVMNEMVVVVMAEVVLEQITRNDEGKRQTDRKRRKQTDRQELERGLIEVDKVGRERRSGIDGCGNS